MELERSVRQQADQDATDEEGEHVCSEPSLFRDAYTYRLIEHSWKLNFPRQSQEGSGFTKCALRSDRAKMETVCDSDQGEPGFAVDPRADRAWA